MGESYWDQSDKEIENEKIHDMEKEYKYITKNYTALTTKLADITVYDLILILKDLRVINR